MDGSGWIWVFTGPDSQPHPGGDVNGIPQKVAEDIHSILSAMGEGLNDILIQLGGVAYQLLGIICPIGTDAGTSVGGFDECGKASLIFGNVGDSRRGVQPQGIEIIGGVALIPADPDFLRCADHHARFQRFPALVPATA